MLWYVPLFFIIVDTVIQKKLNNESALLRSCIKIDCEWLKVGESMAWTQTQRGAGGWKWLCKLELPRWSTGCRNVHPWGQPAGQESWLQSGPPRLCQHYQPSFSPAAGETHRHNRNTTSRQNHSVWRKLHHSLHKLNSNIKSSDNHQQLMNTVAQFHIYNKRFIVYAIHDHPCDAHFITKKSNSVPSRLGLLTAWSSATGCPSTVPEKGNDVAQGPVRPFYHRY